MSRTLHQLEVHLHRLQWPSEGYIRKNLDVSTSTKSEEAWLAVWSVDNYQSSKTLLESVQHRTRSQLSLKVLLQPGCWKHRRLPALQQIFLYLKLLSIDLCHHT